MTKGIILLGFGKRGYSFAAYNMLKSIRYFNDNIPVTFVTDKECARHIDVSGFSKVKYLSEKEYITAGKIDPAKVKTNLYKYLDYDHNLYLDVDGVLLKDIEPLLDKCIDKEGYYFTDVIDSGKRNDVINYSVWASNENIWERFDLNEDSIYPAIQSSWAYIQKSKESRAFFKQVNTEFKKGFDKPLKIQWGGTLPDELFFSAVCAKNDMIPRFDEYPIFFGNKYRINESMDDFYVLSIYGNGGGRTLTKQVYIKMYDRKMQKYMRKWSKGHIYKSNYIMDDKHANHFK